MALSKPSANHGLEPLRYIAHPSFLRGKQWEDGAAIADPWEFAHGHMPDDLTRDCAKRMHYAAYRSEKARRPADRQVWRNRYFALRDRIILGNRKLVFGAVRKRLYRQAAADDLIGECYIVMIKAVAAYNPWMGIRFSTYAYTCLMRALSRLNQRSLADRLSQHLSLDLLEGHEPADDEPATPPGAALRIDEFLEDEHPLLSDREKVVLRRRFRLGAVGGASTLEKVGADLGISKERVRQVQATALVKLREALVEKTPAS